MTDQELETRLAKLESVLGRGNLNTVSVQQKDATFNGRFALVDRTALPSVATPGEIAVKNGALYVASAPNTWTATSGSGGYGGEVDATGSGLKLPSGWTSSYSSGGVFYTITHNLGTTSYVVVATPYSGTAELYPVLIAKAFNSNNFVLQFSTSAGVTGATAFLFSLILI